ncbi:hypothetical protein GH714_016883 [Hevea brasiliensis]|uniref:Uncharacterized protein n=1 Tax=Hevea brasiliensis TaxID=3981 RepID=A0A6A6LAY6_HEVBR|nr:hypothetical protein GH714_016883 [Hevea brasiliensis]
MRVAFTYTQSQVWYLDERIHHWYRGMQERKVPLDPHLDMYFKHLLTQYASAEAREGTDFGALLAADGGDYNTFVERFIVRRLVAIHAPEDLIHPNLLALFIEPLVLVGFEDILLLIPEFQGGPLSRQFLEHWENIWPCRTIEYQIESSANQSTSDEYKRWASLIDQDAYFLRRSREESSSYASKKHKKQ